MQIQFVNNAGGGTTKPLEVKDGTTINQVFEQQLPNRQMGQFHIRVNGKAVPDGYPLRDSDVVTITALKFEGGRS